MYKDIIQMLTNMLNDYYEDHSSIEMKRLLEEKQRNRQRLADWREKIG